MVPGKMSISLWQARRAELAAARAMSEEQRAAALTHAGVQVIALLALSDDPPQGTASPLHALLAWIKRYAGTPVASLAVAEVQMHRQGAELR